jgi:hypothetical protein
MFISCEVSKQFYDRNNKKYIELRLSDEDASAVHKKHVNANNLLQNKKIKNPLEQNFIEVKVPFRYNRVSCKTNSLKPIQGYKVGDTIELDIGFCGVWNIGEWSGFAWKVTEVF